MENGLGRVLLRCLDLCPACKRTPAKPSDPGKIGDHAFQDLAKLIEELKKESAVYKREVMDKLNDFQTTLEFSSEQVNKAMKDNEKLLEELKLLKQQNAAISEENKDFKLQLLEMKSEVVDLQQYSRRLNVEIANYPESDNENIKVITDKIVKVNI